MPVTTSSAGDTLLITIDRPPVERARPRHASCRSIAVFAAAAQDSPKNGVVLTGGGQMFSAGVDTRAFAGYGREQRHRMVLAITRMVSHLLAIPVPVVAAINGHALGGGFVLMLGCDYRMAAASEATKLGMTEARAGIPFPAGPLEIMRHELSGEMLRRMTLTSAVLSVQEVLEAAHPRCAMRRRRVDLASQRDGGEPVIPAGLSRRQAADPRRPGRPARGACRGGTGPVSRGIRLISALFRPG